MNPEQERPSAVDIGLNVPGLVEFVRTLLDRYPELDTAGAMRLAGIEPPLSAGREEPR